MKRFKGQSTLEYVIILSAVIGAIVLVATMLQPKINSTYSGLTDKMSNKVATVNFGP